MAAQQTDEAELLLLLVAIKLRDTSQDEVRMHDEQWRQDIEPDSEGHLIGNILLRNEREDKAVGEEESEVGNQREHALEVGHQDEDELQEEAGAHVLGVHNLFAVNVPAEQSARAPVAEYKEAGADREQEEDESGRAVAGVGRGVHSLAAVLIHLGEGSEHVPEDNELEELAVVVDELVEGKVFYADIVRVGEHNCK